MISYSGTTSELLALLPHISENIPLIAMTSHTHPAYCPLLVNRQNSLLLPAPIHESEKTSFNISAPTTSTTVALALGDALALAVAQKLHTAIGKTSSEVFQSNHPGGAIGAAAISDIKAVNSVLMSDIAMRVDDVHFPPQKAGTESFTSLDILQTAVRSPGGWVRLSQIHIMAPRLIQQIQDMNELIDVHHPAAIEKQDWISILGSCPVNEAKQWILNMRKEGRGRTFLKKGTVLGIVDERNEVSAVVEIEDVAGDSLEDCPA
jgi:hypothetical protein